MILRRFNFNNAGVSPGYGINISNSTRVVFEDCVFEQSDRGVAANNSTLTLTRCQFRNITDRSVTTSYGELVVQNCEFTGNRFGPYSDHDNSVRIESTTITGQTDWGAVVIGPRASLETAGPCSLNSSTRRFRTTRTACGWGI